MVLTAPREAGARVLAAAHAGATDVSGVCAGEFAVVAGVPCMTLPLPYPWANQARPLALDGPVPAAVVREVAGWLTARSPQWTLVVRAEQPAPPGFLPWAVLPALVLRPPLVDVPPPDGVQVGPAASPAEFLAAYGVELAPLVTELHFASPYHRHLVARVGGEPAGCARVRFTGGTAYVSAVTVREPYRRKGLGAALSAAASRIGAAEADVVWLHATNESRPIYERLGYEYIDDHVLLVRQANSAK